MIYYGFMVNELDGSIDNLKCECDYKPAHEVCGFSFAKWFDTSKKRDKVKEYMKNRISEVQKINNEIVI